MMRNFALAAATMLYLGTIGIADVIVDFQAQANTQKKG